MKRPPGATHRDKEGNYWLIETRAWTWVPRQLGVVAGGWTEATALLNQSRNLWPNYPTPIDREA